MASDRLIQNCHFVNATPPIADFYESGPLYTDVVSMQDYEHCTWIIHEAIGLLGTTTVTVQSCDDVDASNTQAIIFRYRAITTGDTHGDITTATTSGFGTTAGSNHIYIIECDAAELYSTYKYVRLACTELVDAEVLGGILCVLSGPRHTGNDNRTAIV